MSFYQSLNAIYSKGKSSDSELICNNPLKSYCLPLISYACEALCPNKRSMIMLNKATDSAVGKLFCTYDSGNILYNNIHLTALW